ncbi:Atypical/BRD protein kinase [Cladophialophora yegresii CBS 114405]|uniref:Atypical/BRD protein kinase n=1 Tax=Cladophialophora yegresii CBS 114405 TaxID=1182544 RepID=W9W805_9EURO|nr:Atypical/BRD protein kinase [Cladophialophora yegresii CBS 114405]EXJ54679.1 Atypical/BRD protein kinase [Cladophialophora yegresii CBS 114405]
MDVELQMEASGMPTQFKSTADQPEVNHIAENMAASISNSEAVVNSSPPKQSADDAPRPDRVGAVSEAVPERALLVPAEAPATNGITDHAGESAQTATSAVPDSQPHPSLENSSTALPAATSTSDSILTESFIPSSIPTEIQSSATPVEPSQSTMDVSEPQPVPAEAPVSDLRTAPHSDALSPEAVAEVEAQKHQLDNSADLPSAPKTDISDTLPYVAPSVDVTANNIGLPSPPAHLPPPAPQPEPAVLPERVPATEPGPAVDTLPPAEPEEPAPTPAVPMTSESTDQIMTDAPALSTKPVHEREEDGDDVQRATKRVKTDEPQSAIQEPHFKVPEVPAASPPALANGDGVVSATITEDGDDTVTPARLAHMKKVVSNLKKSNASANFRLPVDYVSLNIPNYPLVIKHPMDLGTIDNRLKRNEYNSVSAFVADFELIISNCYTFNGIEHGVSQQARKMKQSFDSQMRNLPKASIEEPSKEVKKAARKSEPTRTAPPRRPSVSTSTVTAGSAGSPVSAAAPSTPAFALNPDGMPLIRRDSSITDGRPKRAIVPTKRNAEFGGGRPRKKKYELQLKFCEEVLKDLMSTKNWQANQYFMDPVDPVALNIPTYFQIIKKPMDLKTVKQKLQNNEYERAKDFEEDVRQIFKNCFKFNPDGDLVNNSGHALEALFNSKWATKDEWLSAREPASVTQSDADEDEDDEEEESEDEGNDSEEDRSEQIKQLQKQIEALSKQATELSQKSKKSKSPKAGKKKDKTKVKKEKPEAPAPKASKDKKETKKKSAKKPEKERYVTFAEKQYISNGIAMLPEKQMQDALRIIQQSVPSLANSDQSEIELDIEEVPNSALLKLLGFVKKYAGPPPDEPKAEVAETYHAPANTKSKKSKPMSKHEQEAQIEELKGKLGAYVGPISPNAVPSIETGDSSDDDDSGEESEEE